MTNATESGCVKFRNEAIRGLNLLYIKVKNLQEGLILEKDSNFVQMDGCSDQFDSNLFEDLTREELISKLKSYMEKVAELEKERSSKNLFFTNIIEELEKDKKRLISENNDMKEALEKIIKDLDKEKGLLISERNALKEAAKRRLDAQNENMGIFTSIMEELDKEKESIISQDSVVKVGKS